MTQQERELIEKIKAQPGFTVTPYRSGGGVLIVQELPGWVRQSGVWLGKPKTLESLQTFLQEENK